MRFNRRAMQAICCRAWGLSPDEYREKLASGKIAFADVTAQYQLELMSNPLTAQVISEFVYPGQKADKRKAQHQADNNRAFAVFTAMRDKKGQS